MANAAVVNSEIARMGATAYATKRKVSPKRWKRIVGEAHKKGFTVDSFLDTDTPNALKSRTKSGITAEATRTISEAYKPVEAELSQDEIKTKSMDDKRARDNRYYLDWLTARTGELNTHAKAADQALIDRSKQIADESKADHAAAHDTLVQSAQATAGNVSNPAESKALNDTAESDASSKAIANQRQATVNSVASSEKRAASDQAINFAQIAASESRRQSDTYNKLKDISDGKTKAALAKGADISKEVARLLDQEIDKENSNREFSAALKKLGISSDAIDQRADAAKLSSSDKAKSRALQARIASRAAGQRDQEIKLKADKLDVDWYKAKHGGSSKKGGKEADPQKRFESAVAQLAASEFSVKDKDGKDKVVKNKAEYVKKRRDQMVAALMGKEKVSREIASRAVDAFIQNGGLADPGSYKGYAQKKTHGPNP